MYKALITFTDLQDNNYKYQAGDVFPRKGLKVSDARIKELLSNKNRRNKPVIEEVVEEIKEEKKPAVTPKKTGASSGRKKTNAE